MIIRHKGQSDTCEMEPIASAAPTSRAPRGVILIALAVGIVACAGYLVRVQLQAPISAPREVTPAAHSDALPPTAEPAPQPALTELPPGPGASQPGAAPNAEADAPAAEEIVVTVRVSGSRLQLASNLPQELEYYPLQNPEARRRVILPPGQEVAVDVSGPTAEALGERSVTLRARMGPDGPVFSAEPDGLPLYVNGKGWPNDRFRAGEPNRIGFNLSAGKHGYGIALVGAQLPSDASVAGANDQPAVADRRRSQ